MFNKSIRTIGNFEILEINNQDNSHKLSVIPEKGLIIRELIFNNLNLIDGVESAEEIADNPTFKSTLLAPFPNRINNGTYVHNSDTYQLEINEPPRNNALHGFIYDKPFQLVDENYNHEEATITFNYNYNGEIAGYPFPFKSEVNMKISTLNGFELTMHFENLSHVSIPFGFGWHPYFRLNGNVNQLDLKLPGVKKYDVTQQMIPTGETSAFEDFSEQKNIGHTELDTCFEIINKNGTAETLLKDPVGNTLKIWQETGDKKFNFLQCFTPPHRKSIAIEPQSCCIDAFNNRYGLAELQVGEKVSAKMGITLN